jgi:hypothetical protein
VVLWTYDLRGLDLVAWAQRAAEDLALARAPEDEVVLLVGAAPEDALAMLRTVLAAAGYAAREQSLLGIRALVLVPASDAPR